MASLAAPGSAELLLRETVHRCGNDLQLVVGLLALQSRRATAPEARAALADATERVAVLARARRALDRAPSLEAALRGVCEALHAHAEPRGIDLSLDCGQGEPTLDHGRVTTVALVVNELATNAIKHAFDEGVGGRISIVARRLDERTVSVVVDDDGLPFPEPGERRDGGLGLGLARRLMASVDGLFIPPPPGSKAFELRVPA